MNDLGNCPARRRRFAACAALGVILITLSAAAAPCAARAADTYVDTLLREKSTRRSGFAMYVPHPATLGEASLSHALVTEVGGAGESQTLSVLSLRLDGRYARFQATVGRESATADDRAAGAYFEVWGDGDCLFRSAALYPARGGQRRGKDHPGDSPQQISVAVRGVRTLQLVTRYAAEATPSGAHPSGGPRASGCIWGDPRLSGAESDDAATAPYPVTAPSADAGEAAATDSRRDAIRFAALLLAAGIPPASAAGNDGAAARLPVRVALLPLRPCSRSGGSRRRRGGAWTEPADAAVQSTLRAALPAARRGSSPIFDLLSEKATEPAARALPGPVAAGISPPQPSDLSPSLEECRKSGAATLALATLLPGAAGAESHILELKLFDVHSGTLIASCTRPLPRTAALPLRP